MKVLATIRINPRKLLMSKWTSVSPVAKEKHFLVLKVHQPEDRLAPIEWVELEAVMTHRIQRIAWRALCDTSQWQQGWH